MRITLLLLISLFFNSCGQVKPECKPKKIYVKTKVPRLIVLHRVEPYEIKDFGSLDDTYYKVNKKQLHGASKASQKRIHNIHFYEKQCIKFNKDFVK